MLNIGFGEILLIGCLLLVVVGPERLPKMLRMAGKQYAKLRRAANELQHAFMDEGDLLDASYGEPLDSPSDLPGHTPVRPKSDLDEQRVPVDPSAALAAARAKRAEVLAEARDDDGPQPHPQAVELEPGDGTADEPVEREQAKRPVDVSSLPLDESQGDW